MNKYVYFIPLLIGVITSAVADTPELSVIEDSKHSEPNHWNCYITSDAQERKNQVEYGILPHVVFDGEITPSNIESQMAISKTPALSVAVIHNGKLDWSAAWGQIQTGGPQADCSSLFQAGSLAKPVTVLAAMRMKAKGKIDFDRSIETYLSSYQLPAGRQTSDNPVTFRNLLSHTSGVTRGGYEGYAKNEQIPSDQQIARGEAPSNSRKVEVANLPGTLLAYSGGGYTVVEIALQDQLHKPFNQIMREWLFGPIDMKQADFTIPLPDSLHPHTARGHQIDGTIIPGGWNNYPEQAAAGLWATATDLAMFLLEIHKGYEGKSKVFTQANIRELLDNPIQNHVYGFRLIGKGDQIFITHYGGTVGYRSGMTLNLQTGNGAVFLTNSDNGSNLGEAFFSSVSRAYGWPMFKEERVKRMKHSSAVLKSLTGTYVFPEQGWKVSVIYEHNLLRLIFPSGNRLPLVMTPIQGKYREFVHETGVHANFEGEGLDLKIQLFGQTGRRQTNGKQTDIQ
ncbi:MAG: CubicO group peptidase (beta-lactamase class C family) [Paraglaciecola sp.]|jgi:CubicO group peptidase (beta-lactamase class C family)